MSVEEFEDRLKSKVLTNYNALDVEMLCVINGNWNRVCPELFEQMRRLTTLAPNEQYRKVDNLVALENLCIRNNVNYRLGKAQRSDVNSWAIFYVGW